MKRSILRLLPILLAAAPSIGGANTLPAGKDTQEFMVGITGIFAAINGGELKVTQVPPNTPAAGRIEKDDRQAAARSDLLALPEFRVSR